MTMNQLIPFDQNVRLAIYHHLIQFGMVPSIQEIADVLQETKDRMTDSFRRLAEYRAIVVQPEDQEKIVMVMPFSAIPTPFDVKTEQGHWWANCIWDALGIAAMLNIETTIHTRSGAIGEPLTLTVKDDSLSDWDLSIHFAIPAAQWWQDIVFT